MHDVRVWRALTLRHEGALRLQREKRRLLPRARFPYHLAHPKAVRPNGEIVVLTTEGVEEKETETDGRKIEELD